MSGARKLATCQDLLDLPETMTGEIIDGALITMTRPRPNAVFGLVEPEARRQPRAFLLTSGRRWSSAATSRRPEVDRGGIGKARKVVNESDHC